MPAFGVYEIEQLLKCLKLSMLPSDKVLKKFFGQTTSVLLYQAWASRGPDLIIGNEVSQTWSSPMPNQSRVIKLMV